MRLRDISIKQKMLLMMVTTSLLVLALATAAWIAYNHSALRRSSVDNLRATAGIIGSNASAALNFKSQEDGVTTLNALQEKRQIIEAAIFDSNGDLFASYARHGEVSSVPKKVAESAEDINFSSRDIVLFRKIGTKEDFLGTVYLRSDLSEIEEQIVFGLKLAGIIFLTAIVLAILISLWLQTFVTNPIKHLVALMQRVSKDKTFHLRAEKLANDETGMLADSFNAMLVHLEERDGELARYREQLEEKVEQRTLELKKTSLAFQESEQIIRAIVDTAADGIITFNQQGQILSLNKAASEIFEYSMDELVGKDLAVIAASQRNSGEELMLAQHLIARARKSAIVGREFEGLSKTGRSFPMELSLTHVALGEKELFTAILRDITERKAAEAQLIRAKEEAETLARTKSQFLANMSHEIRTPMNGIFGALQIVLKSPLNPEQKEFLDIMHDSADSLLKIIDDVLDFSKVDAGKLQLEAISFDLRETFKKSLNVILLKAQESKILFDIVVDEMVPALVKGDPHRLGQILINLTSNALKFTSSGGKVSVLVGVESCDQSSIELHFIVKDNGIGIPTEKQKAIFEAFTQADTSSTRRFGGTGLGLAIVTNLVKLMNGKIWVHSRENEGSEFHFTVSLQIQAAVEKKIGLSDMGLLEKESLGSINVLLVEDHPINQKVQRRFLENLGLEVTLAENGRQAVEYSSEENFDVILMDCQMPEMDGFEATQAIRTRENSSGKHVPIVAMTAHALVGDRERCLDAGMDAYISKPINEDELKDVLNRILKKV